MVALEILRRVWQRIGPYLVVEILLPGGTLLALLLFLYRRQRLRVGRGASPTAGVLVPAVAWRIPALSLSTSAATATRVPNNRRRTPCCRKPPCTRTYPNLDWGPPVAP